MIIDNTTSGIYYGNKRMSSMYFGSTPVWNSTTSTVLATGSTVNAAINKSATSFTRSTTPPPDINNNN